MNPTSKLGYITNLQKERHWDVWNWVERSSRGNNEGLNFSLTFGKNSLGSIIGPLELFGNYWEVWVGNCGRQMKKPRL